ncbi:hypothetical protein [Blastococcus sp. TF02A-30]|uniref:hypothetical protein n=1 Tax=Blastococcus sp. TF02A-30 TaxID=2250580 RepID=UPI000DEAADBE|nr:hypothetical protein [Blastococcus sp. TF02A-30]RBY89392.1 hypothetical protein DQ241_07945 [Blastococcus sp. TF02A-30]
MELRPRRHLRRTALAALVLAGAALTAACQSAIAAPAAPDDVVTGTPVVVTGVDWKAVAYDAAGCPSREAWLADGLPAADWDDATVTTTSADVTSDGRPETLIALACPAAVSAPSQRVVVLDLSGSAPRPLGVLGGELGFSAVDVAAGPGTVTLTGPTVGGDDPTCCPTHEGTLVLRWTGKGFAVDSRIETASAGPALPDGEHVGVLRSAATGTVEVDLVEWFEGDDAAAACTEDGVTDLGVAWCTQYYVRDADAAVTALPVRDGARLAYLDLADLTQVPVAGATDLVGTSALPADPEAATYVRLTTVGGSVTALEGVFTP